MEDEEALEPGAVVGELSDAVKAEVNNFLADGIVATGVVVGGILLTRDKLLGVVKLSVGAGSHLVKRSRLKIEKDGAARWRYTRKKEKEKEKEKEQFIINFP